MQRVVIQISLIAQPSAARETWNKLAGSPCADKFTTRYRPTACGLHFSIASHAVLALIGFPNLAHPATPFGQYEISNCRWGGAGGPSRISPLGVTSGSKRGRNGKGAHCVTHTRYAAPDSSSAADSVRFVTKVSA
jgi:hypothetical protein